MTSYSRHFFRLILISLFFLSNKSLQAQTIPDRTLGTESSKINSISELRSRIEGGATRKENLFHSFEQFNVNEGLTVDFANPEGITNIFSRVTGNNISEIFGTLGVDGNANLFLMNPNGIVFGENAAININGSFLATTAETIDFDDGSKFNAIKPNKPLITINFPIGLGFSTNNNGSINIEGQGHSLNLPVVNPLPTIKSSRSPGLQAKQGRNVAFIADEVNFDGGILITREGIIDLGGVEEGIVDFDIELWKFDYSNVSVFGDVNLYNTSWLDISNMSSSDTGIKIQGRNINIKDESVILSQNFTDKATGSIELNATDSITISKIEISPFAVIPGGIISEAASNAIGSNIYMNAPRVSLLDGGSVISRTVGFGKAGDIIVEATTNLELIGASELDIPPVLSNISNIAFPAGSTGLIKINTPSISILDGATITNIAAGTAIGKDVVINSDSIKISGTDNVSGLSASSISSSSSGFSQGADIYVNAVDIRIEEGAAIGSFSFDTGTLGNISINASNSIKVNGIAFQTQNSSSIVSTVLLADEESREIFSEIDIELSNIAIGDSGKISINTPDLEIADGAFISVLNQGAGDAGNLEIDANEISLKNAGQISASTLLGEGGNITLNADNLQLFNQSQITASAGGSGNGGNITIGSDNILGIGNSDITANAIGGDGGNITINSDAILGLEERSQLTPFGDITATSEFGVDGTVTINSPNLDFESEVFAALNFSTRPPALSLLEARCLNPRRREGKLLYVGRGGVPQNPGNFFDDGENTAIYGVPKDQPQQEENEPQVWIEGDPIIEFNVVKTATNGDIYLAAETRLENVDSGICQSEKK